MSRTQGSVATLLETAATIRKAKNNGQTPFGLIHTLATMLRADSPRTDSETRIQSIGLAVRRKSSALRALWSLQAGRHQKRSGTVLEN
jgi:hypothetical protein